MSQRLTHFWILHWCPEETVVLKHWAKSVRTPPKEGLICANSLESFNSITASIIHTTGASSKANKKRRQMEKLETDIKPLKHNLKLAGTRAPSLKTQEHWTCWECVSSCLSRILILEKGKRGEILPIQNLDCRIEPRWCWHWCCFCCCADGLCPPGDWPFLESKEIEEQ